MGYSDGPTEEAAEELISEEAKWAINASKEECEAFARKVVLKHLFTEKDEVTARGEVEVVGEECMGKRGEEVGEGDKLSRPLREGQN